MTPPTAETVPAQPHAPPTTTPVDRAFGPEDRRRRRRRPTRLPGWAYRGGDAAAGRVDEVVLRNVSPEGAGFVSPVAFDRGEAVSLKIGLGPTRRPRPAEVAFVRRRADGRFDVGVRFVAAPVAFSHG